MLFSVLCCRCPASRRPTQSTCWSHCGSLSTSTARRSVAISGRRFSCRCSQTWLNSVCSLCSFQLHSKISINIGQIEQRKEVFYLTTHSSHLRLYFIRLGKDPKRNSGCCYFKGYSFRLADRIAHTTTFVTPVMEHWLERKNTWMGPLCMIKQIDAY